MMKITPVIISAICLNMAVACNSTSTEESSTTMDTVEAPAANTPTQPQLEDPDPTDTIPASAYNPRTYGKETQALIKSKLEEMYKDDLSKDMVSEYSRKFAFFEYDLDDDGNNEIFVGLTGPYFCGSGGCSFLILDKQGNKVTNFSVSDYPVIVASTKTNNWKDLIITSNGKNHWVKFNGKTYPSNPSVQPVMNELPGDDLPRVLNMYNEPYPWFKF